MSELGLVFDTETTGKRDFKKPITAPHQPDAVQIAALLFDGDKVRGSMNFVVVPGKPSEAEAEEKHQITAAIIDRCGVPLNVAVPAFNNLLKRADFIVAHNIAFDVDIISRSYWQFGADPTLVRDKRRVCTMKSSTKTCNLPGGRNGEGKWPTLQEAYKHFVDPEGFDGAHDAMVDVMACWKVYLKLVEQGIPLIS